MKKWIEFILLILGIGFIASLTAKAFKKNETNENNDSNECKNYKHMISLKYFEEDNTYPTIECHFDLVNSNSSSYEHNYNGLISYLSSLSYFDNDLNKNVCFIDNDGIYQFNSDGESVDCFNLFVVSDSVNYVCFGHEGLPGMVVSGPFDFVRSDRLWDVHVVVSDSVIETNDDLTVSKRMTDYGIHHNNENVE